MAAFVIGVFEGDFDAYKATFDSDPLGRKQVAKGHTILRGVDNPNEVFVRIEFDSAEAAKAFAEKVRGSDVLQNMAVKVPPTAVQLADQATY
jgi:heme-degrading monooxygenase HmoA